MHEELMERLARICRKDRRYYREAYLFVLSLIDFSQFKRYSDEEVEAGDCHVSPQNLAHDLPEHALRQFGVMAEHFLQYNGIRTPFDLAEVLRNLFDEELLRRHPQDGLYTIHSHREWDGLRFLSIQEVGERGVVYSLGGQIL